MSGTSDSRNNRLSWRERFRRFSHATSQFVGSPVVFSLACLAILSWAVTGPMFGYSDTWQLVINTGTTIVTFLMVFLIQNTQNRDTRAIHLKLDELIRAMKGARNKLVDLEQMSEEELDKLQEQFQRLSGIRKAADAKRAVKRKEYPRPDGGLGAHRASDATRSSGTPEASPAHIE